MKFNRDWLADPQVFAVNRMPAHSSHPFKDAKDQDLYQRLDGTWQFHYAENLSAAPQDFDQTDLEQIDWSTITVPGHIQLQGWGRPHYVNTMYPWDGHEKITPGQIPQAFNPVGTYRRSFHVPLTWQGQSVYISFQGAETGLAVWCNGHFVGYREDSFTPAEFDLTPCLSDGQNTLIAQVFRFCSGSWLEDQDFWRFSGICRDVLLYTTPRTHICDVWARPELSADFAQGSLPVTVQLTGELQGSVELAFNGQSTRVAIDGPSLLLELAIALPRLWSAESPNLYPYILKLYAADGSLLESVSLQAGFRRFGLTDGLMTLNGQRIVFKGVNRHEWDCRNGRVITLAEIRQDIINIKRNNMNAVRTCHYPNHLAFYDLCDEYGLYVIDETNLETHGTWQKLGAVLPDENTIPNDNPLWHAAVLDRANNMFQRDKNHACILIWSCGNESYGGSNIFDMSNLFRSLDSSRLVHYEGIVHDRRYNATSDMESQMYPSVADIEAFLAVHRDKPFICCEYSHAMGNSCGALHKYTDITENEPLYQGGFIWDYIDQGLLTEQCLANGKPGGEYLAYGGDFGDQPTDYNFCGNGLVYADRTNTPKMQEVKFCYQDYTLRPSENGIIVKNKSLFTNTGAYTLQVELRREGVLLASAQLAADSAPGTATSLPLPFALPDQAGEYLINVSLLLKEATSWASAGHEVAFGQAIVPISYRQPAQPDVATDAQPWVGQNIRPRYEQAEQDTSASLLPVTVINSDINIGVKGANFHAIFSRSAAGLVSYRFKDRELLKDVPQINFWRAPTDNDRGCQMPFDYAIWKTAGRYARLERISLEEGPFSASITFDYRLTTSDRAGVKACYTVSGDGTIAVELTYRGRTNPSVPEFGLMLVLPADLVQVEYYGLGPDENYCDRQMGARMGCFSYDVQDNLARYLRPQECGNRCHVQRAAVMNAAGAGLLFSSDDMEFSALPYTPHELENARHLFELPPVCQTVVRCNAGQMGVGGDNSWGARTLDEYLLRLTEDQSFRFSFRGI